jgi:hypothetical protein
VARGIGILAPDAETARERFLAEAPDRKVIAVVPLDISDIPLRVPFDEPYWAIAFEDPDPGKFLQDVDPIAKATRDVREGLQTMVADPEALVTGQVEGNVVCPGCGATVHLELPPEDMVRRPDFGPLLYAGCPECRAELVGPKGPGRIDWRVRPAPVQIPQVDPPAALGRGRGERRACVFCGAEDRKISKEHLWSKWMATYVEPAGGSRNRKSRVLSTKTGQVKDSESWPEAAFGQEVSGPCKLCNEGWMEQIEEDARPFLIPMLEDRETELRPEDQRAVAHWATLKLLVGHLGHPAEKQSIPAARFRQFFIDRSLPVGARVWLGRYDGSGTWPTHYRYLELFVSENGGTEPELSNGYLASFSVGHLAFFYWGHELPQGPLPDVSRVTAYLTSVWPATGTARWPPEASLDGDGMRFVMERFPLDRWMRGAGPRAFQTKAAGVTSMRSDPE